MTETNDRILALDVGTVRIGVATALASIRIASPLTTIANDHRVMANLSELIAVQQATVVVIGLPRSLDGNETPQTQLVRTFASQLETELGVSVQLQDEALTSHKAENELAARGKQYAKGEVDALAATYILEDYLQEQRSNH